jgi:hypothetical protein
MSDLFFTKRKYKLKTLNSNFVIKTKRLCENFNQKNIRYICRTSYFFKYNLLNYQKHPPQYLDVFQHSTYLAALNVVRKFISCYNLKRGK